MQKYKFQKTISYVIQILLNNGYICSVLFETTINETGSEIMI